MSKNLWLTPAYFKDFKCKCDKCRHSCCHGWKIPVSKQEYEKLIAMECDDELYSKIQISFVNPDVYDEERYKIIAFNFLGDCPIQKNGLCTIHAQLGESVLPSVCRLYPRSLKEVNGTNVACCSSSCERVVEMLLDCDSLNLTYSESDYKPMLKVDVGEELISELKQYGDILKDHSTSLVQSLSDICLQIDEDEFNKDYQKDLNPLWEALRILNRLTDENSFLAEIMEKINDRYNNNYDQYEIDKKRFETDFPDWQNYFENVINNSLLYENFPFIDQRFDKVNAYKGLCGSYGLLRVVCIGYHSCCPTKEDLVDAISALFHLIDHTAFYYNVHILTPAAALFLKL